MKNHCIFVLHGSASAEAKKICDILEKQFSQKLEIPFYISYLKESSPSFSEALDLAYSNGARSIICLPLFLLPGSHIIKDIPSIIDNFTKVHSDCNIKLLPCLAENEQFINFIIKILGTNND